MQGKITLDNVRNLNITEDNDRNVVLTAGDGDTEVVLVMTPQGFLDLYGKAVQVYDAL